MLIVKETYGYISASPATPAAPPSLSKYSFVPVKNNRLPHNKAEKPFIKKPRHKTGRWKQGKAASKSKRRTYLWS